jgi:hypothetical protein
MCNNDVFANATDVQASFYATELAVTSINPRASVSAQRAVGVFSGPSKLSLSSGSTSNPFVTRTIALGVEGLKEGVAGERPGVEIV